MEYYDVVIQNIKSKEESVICIEAEEAEETPLIVLLTHVDGKEFIASSMCYFQAFQELKELLLKKGYGMKCKGSLVNAVQSPMMSISDKIYLVEMGKHASLKDCVSMYEYIDIDKFASTLQQMDYFEEWYTSIHG